MRWSKSVRTNPATVVGIGYVHDFVAIGTANGVGVANCANDYDPNWTIFSDGMIGGVYFCNDHVQDAYGAGASPGFNINYGFCPSASANRWLLNMGGALRACIASGSTTGSRVIAMLETTGGGTTDRNIDVKFKSLQHRSAGTGYVDWGTASQVIAPSYKVTQPTGTQVNVFLPPLD